jgi:heme-degrading monooxygenase HmoA
VYARVAVYELPRSRVDEGVLTFRDAAEGIRGLNGLTDVFFLVSHESGRAVTVTLWETAADMAASRVRATGARSRAARDVAGGVTSVEEFEVAFHLDGS